MKLKEIVAQDDFVKDAADLLASRYRASGENLIKFDQLGSYTLLLDRFGSPIDSSSKRFFILYGKKPIGWLILSKFKPGLPYLQVTSTFILPDFQRKGIMQSVYKSIIDHDMPIVSGKSQTKSAKEFWRNFIGKVKMYSIDSEDPKNQLTPIETQDDFNKIYDGTSYNNLVIMK